MKMRSWFCVHVCTRGIMGRFLSSELQVQTVGWDADNMVNISMKSAVPSLHTGLTFCCHQCSVALSLVCCQLTDRNTSHQALKSPHCMQHKHATHCRSIANISQYLYHFNCNSLNSSLSAFFKTFYSLYISMPLYSSVDCRRTTINIFSHNENYHYNFNGKNPDIYLFEIL